MQINVNPTSMSVYKTGNFVKNIWPNVVNYTPPPLSLTIKVLEGTVTHLGLQVFAQKKLSPGSILVYLAWARVLSHAHISDPKDQVG